MIEVIIADDNREVRRTISRLLESDGIEVVAEASAGRQAIELVERQRPDVLVADMDMPDLTGVGVLKGVMALDEKTEVVIISFYLDKRIIRAALEQGARGFVASMSLIDHIIRAVRSAVRGQQYLCPATRLALGGRSDGSDRVRKIV